MHSYTQPSSTTNDLDTRKLAPKCRRVRESTRTSIRTSSLKATGCIGGIFIDEAEHVRQFRIGVVSDDTHFSTECPIPIPSHIELEQAHNRSFLVLIIFGDGLGAFNSHLHQRLRLLPKGLLTTLSRFLLMLLNLLRIPRRLNDRQSPALLKEFNLLGTCNSLRTLHLPRPNNLLQPCTPRNPTALTGEALPP
jgi:hypothetical protein